MKKFFKEWLVLGLVCTALVWTFFRVETGSWFDFKGVADAREWISENGEQYKATVPLSMPVDGITDDYETAFSGYDVNRVERVTEEMFVSLAQKGSFNKVMLFQDPLETGERRRCFTGEISDSRGWLHLSAYTRMDPTSSVREQDEIPSRVPLSISSSSLGPTHDTLQIVFRVGAPPTVLSDVLSILVVAFVLAGLLVGMIWYTQDG